MTDTGVAIFRASAGAEYVLAIDCGLSVTKAVVFDAALQPVGEATMPSPRRAPHPKHVERDAEELWRLVGSAVGLAVRDIDARRIKAVAVTGHGDGLYLVDAAGRPTRPAVTSLDSRADDIVARWRAEGLERGMAARSGSFPMPSSPAAILRWYSENDPEALRRSTWALSCKDFVNLRLTDAAATDLTSASESFTNVETQDYDDGILAAYGLESVRRLLPPIRSSQDVVGLVSDEGAAATGLAAGTPVVAGLHDVDASALGCGVTSPGQLVLIGGTYSVNGLISDRASTDAGWMARSFVRRGTWMNMSVSPASTTCLEWFLSTSGSGLRHRAEAASRDVYDVVADACREVGSQEDNPFFFPFLFGAPAGVTAGAAFLGLRGWHDERHLAYAVFEGIAFNHRYHVELLRQISSPTDFRLTGGIARSAWWSQLFSDILQAPLGVVAERETGARGAAACALAALDGRGSAEQIAAALSPAADVLYPDPAAARRLQRRYVEYLTYLDRVDVQRPVGTEEQIIDLGLS